MGIVGPSDKMTLFADDFDRLTNPFVKAAITAAAKVPAPCIFEHLLQAFETGGRLSEGIP